MKKPKFNFGDKVYSKILISNRNNVIRPKDKVEITGIRRTLDGDYIYTCDYYDPIDIKEKDLY